MLNTVKIRVALLSVLAVLLASLSLLFLGTPIFNTPNQFELVQLDNGWTISRDNESLNPDSLTSPRRSTGIINKGDVITLKHLLPDSHIDPATVSFKTTLSSVRVLVDEALIYSFGDEFAKSGRMLPKMQHFVQLPENFQGKELIIEITSQENDSFSGFSPVYFGNYNDIRNNLVQSKRLPMAIGIYLCHLGFLLLILAPFVAFSQNHDFSIFLSAVTSIFMGVYILCYNDIFSYIANSSSFYTFIEYFSLSMIPASILGFVLTAGQTRYYMAGIILLASNLVFVIVSTILHITGIIHICHFVPFLHLLAIVEGVFIIISLSLTAVNQKKAIHLHDIKRTSTNMLILGLLVFLSCSAIDILKFNIMKHSRVGEANVSINFMTIGSVVFIMCLLLNYFYHCIEYINDSSEKKQLEGIAYNDPLTGLNNRTRCEMVLAELTGNYTIISMDLDYLKYTNDNYGHDKGDRLLTGFSEILGSCFKDASLIGRMGGDEFLVVLPFINKDRTEKLLSDFSDEMNRQSTKDNDIRYSASYGYASCKDPELAGNTDPKKVYLLADKRMYVMKTIHHDASLGRLYDDLIGKLLKKGGNLHA
ncbi:MAG: diguanylate cyclase [Butyrivibrio sp.]|nr:diguanylate cyclase [Butyrivibrio sp.]